MLILWRIPFKTSSSAALDIADLLAIRAVVHEAFLDFDLNGIVIFHGTGSLEETAFFLHLTSMMRDLSYWLGRSVHLTR